MTHQTKLLIVKATAVLLPTVPVLIYAHSAGPPPGAAGPPSDRSCSSIGCHNPSTGGTGSVNATFANNTAQYVPGMKQHIILTISDPSQRRWGFQTTARPSSNPRSGEAGRFDSTDGNTQIVCQDDSPRPLSHTCPSPGFEYIEHSLSGTRPGTPSPVTFEFDWTPPATGAGDILFYVAANAANGDGTPLGDHIYYQTTTVHQASTPGDPVIAASGILNAASGSAVISANGWVSIYGNGLSTATRSWTASDFDNGKLPTALDGVSVTINNAPAYVAYISPVQINVLAPADAAPGSSLVQVINNGLTSNPATASVQSLAPALFQGADGTAVAQHSDYSLVGSGNGATPAKPGETIIIYGSGFGQTDPRFTPGQLITNVLPLPTSQPVTVTIGGLPAPVTFAGMTPGSAGLYQFNIVVPATSAGTYPIVISYQGAQTQTGVTLPVQP